MVSFEESFYIPKRSASNVFQILKNNLVNNLPKMSNGYVEKIETISEEEINQFQTKYVRKWYITLKEIDALNQKIDLHDWIPDIIKNSLLIYNDTAIWDSQNDSCEFVCYPNNDNKIHWIEGNVTFVQVSSQHSYEINQKYVDEPETTTVVNFNETASDTNIPHANKLDTNVCTKMTLKIKIMSDENAYVKVLPYGTITIGSFMIRNTIWCIENMLCELLRLLFRSSRDIIIQNSSKKHD